MTGDLLQAFATVVRTSRRARRWSQRQLAAKVGISQAHQARLERKDVPDLSFRLAGMEMRVLGGRLDVQFIAPQGPGRIRDEAHARCIAFVARKLARAGFLVATEVDVGTDRWPGFADLIAFDPRIRVLYVIELKTEIHDLGEIDRQLGVGERGAWGAAHQRGWRPWRVVGVLLVLATEENDRRLAEHRAIFDRQYPARWRELGRLLAGDAGTLPERGARGLAMVDPRSRHRVWLRPTWIDGRRTATRYVDRLAYLAGRGRL